MLSRPRTALALGLIVVGVAVAASNALGDPSSPFDSKVTLSRDNPFHGHVSSPFHGCAKERTVTVFRVRPGLSERIRKTDTDWHGEWSIPTHRHGAYYARVAKRSRGGKVVCKQDRSATRRFGG